MAGGKKNKNVINEADFKNNPALVEKPLGGTGPGIPYRYPVS